MKLEDGTLVLDRAQRPFEFMLVRDLILLHGWSSSCS
jgi:hypothetical protein